MLGIKSVLTSAGVDEDTYWEAWWNSVPQQGLWGSNYSLWNSWLASFLGSSLLAQVYSVTFDQHKKLEGEPGELYPVSDIKGSR